MLMFTVLNLIKLPLTKSFSLKIGCKKYNLSYSVLDHRIFFKISKLWTRGAPSYAHFILIDSASRETHILCNIFEGFAILGPTIYVRGRSLAEPRRRDLTRGSKVCSFLDILDYHGLCNTFLSF